MRKFIAALAIVALSAPAFAQQIGTVPTVKRSNSVVVEALHDFAVCAARRQPQRAAQILAMDHQSSNFHDAIDKLVHEEANCTMFGLNFNQMLLAGGLAEGLIQRANVQGLSARLVWHEGDPVLQAQDNLEFTGLCIARTAPEAAVALISAKPASSEESTAFATILPLLPDCVRKDVPLQVNRPGLRAAVALAVYRIARISAGTN